MDAIGLSVGLAGASFGSNEGYRIFAGTFYIQKDDGNGYITIVSKTFKNPVQGIMGWFGTQEANLYSQSDASKSASNHFTTNIALNPKFISPNVMYTSEMNEAASDSNENLKIEFTPGVTTTIDFKVNVYAGRYGVICCYFLYLLLIHFYPVISFRYDGALSF